MMTHHMSIYFVEIWKFGSLEGKGRASARLTHIMYVFLRFFDIRRDMYLTIHIYSLYREAPYPQPK